MCGQCCEGRGGIIVSPQDLLRICNYLNITQLEFKQTYCLEHNGKLKIRSGEDGFCVFFRQGKGCSVHEGKPSICRAWPFFKGNIVDPESLALAKQFCPGIDPNVSHEDFSREGIKYLSDNHLLAKDSLTEANALII